jgi:hypothetical protein
MSKLDEPPLVPAFPPLEPPVPPVPAATLMVPLTAKEVLNVTLPPPPPFPATELRGLLAAFHTLPPPPPPPPTTTTSTVVTPAGTVQSQAEVLVNFN